MKSQHLASSDRCSLNLPGYGLDRKTAAFSALLYFGYISLAWAEIPVFKGADYYSLGAAPSSGTVSMSVVTGDLNGDGKDDIVSADGVIHVLLNKGNGAFMEDVKYFGGVSANLLAIGDLNGDDKPDIVATNNFNGDSVGVLINKGKGILKSVASYSVDGSPGTVKISDLNSDGKNDLVTGNGDVLLNNGKGTFKSAVHYDVGGSYYAVGNRIDVGDLNGDGKPDFAGAKRVFLNVGAGKFKATTDYPRGLTDIHIADVNMDGKPDIVSPEGIMINKDKGVFSYGFSGYIVNDYSLISVGDLDGDDRLDVVTVHGHDGTSSSIYLNSGDGVFVMQGYVLSFLGSDFHFIIKDVNGDGKPDLVRVGNMGYTGGSLSYLGTVTVLMNSGNGIFEDRQEFFSGPGANAMAFGDFDGDGKDNDLVAANTKDDSVSVFLNNVSDSQVALGAPVYYRLPDQMNSFKTGDINLDGKPDIVAAVSNYVFMLLNDGKGGFLSDEKYFLPGYSESLDVKDINNDSKNDVIVINNDKISSKPNYRVSVLINDGKGKLKSPVNYAVSNYARSVAVGDVNGDAKLDIVVADDAKMVEVLTNTGVGKFKPPIKFDAGGDVKSLSLGDLNKDGKLDIVTAHGGVGVLMNTGKGTFKTAVNYDVDSATRVAIGDLNGDKNPDLATDGYSSVSVLLNTGAGVFGQAIDYDDGNYPVAVAIGEVTGDGKPDLIIATEANRLKILPNEGTDTLGSATSYDVISDYFLLTGLGVKDLNGDGKLDVVVGGSYGVNVLLSE